MRCCGALLPRGQGGRRCVLLAITVLTVLFLHLLVHRQVLESFTLLRLRAGVGESVAGAKALQVTSRSPATTPPLQNTVKNGSKATTVKKDDFLKSQVILNEWPPEVKFPLMLFNNPGRLGNRLNSYAVALTFHAAHNATATTAVTRDSMNQLVTLLDTTRLILPVVDGNLVNEARKKGAHVLVDIPSWKKNDMISHLEPAYQRGEKEYRETGKPKMYSLEGYPNRMYLLAGHHDTIRAAFRFKEDLKQKVARFLEGVRERRGRRDITFVGFHIRRTDYTRHM